MVEKIYEQLKTPKTLEQVIQRINEVGIGWNRAQVELFLQMDSNIIKSGDLYYVKGNDLDSTVLDIIEKAIEGRAIIPIKKVMEFTPNEMIISAEEIVKIAVQSKKYKLHPNGAVLMKISD